MWAFPALVSSAMPRGLRRGRSSQRSLWGSLSASFWWPSLALNGAQTMEEEHVLARDIILVMDLSGSMQTDLKAGGGKKIDLAKEAALRFVERRRRDRIGLLVFGDETYGSWPLSTDLEVIREMLRGLKPDLGGTDLAKPLEKALRHLQEFGQSKARAIILVTDGQAAIPADRRYEILSRAQMTGARLYLMGIELEPAADIVELVTQAGGTVWTLTEAEEFKERFRELDRLEPSVVVTQTRASHRDVFSWLAMGGLALLALAIISRATFALQLP